MDNLVANGVYHPGEGIHLKIRFQNGATIKRIRATFVHEKDKATKIILSGPPNRLAENEWLAILSGRATSNLGAYQCVSLEAQYDGGYEMAFRAPLPEATLIVIEPSVRRPALVDGWEWASD
jgi:hypothetical protein